MLGLPVPCVPIQEVARVLTDPSYAPFLKQSIQDRFGMVVDCEDPRQISALAVALERIPAALVKDSGIKFLGFKDLGPSKEYYPNHGLYVGNKLFLNTQLLEDEQIFVDKSGRSLNRFEHTLYHEMGHGWDDIHGLPSSLPAWLGLSGWSPTAQPGLSRITIIESGVPDKVGEWYFSPQAGFPRFYAKMNPWDDFADCFAFYVGGLGGFLPANKTKYLDTALWQYWVSP